MRDEVKRKVVVRTTSAPSSLIPHPSSLHRWGEWLLTPARLAVHVPSGTAVVADLHLGYALVRRRGGDAVPSPSVAEELRLLGEGMRAAGVRRLVVAGDLFEDGRHRRAEMEAGLLAWLAAEGVELAGVVPGNHDRGLAGSGLPVVAEMRLGGWHVVHGDGAAPAGAYVQGHEHPCLRLAGAAASCFLLGEGRLVLPAYSADAAGCGVLGDARWSGMGCAAIVAGRVLDFGRVSAIRGQSGSGERNP